MQKLYDKIQSTKWLNYIIDHLFSSHKASINKKLQNKKPHYHARN